VNTPSYRGPEVDEVASLANTAVPTANAIQRAAATPGCEALAHA
jgi:hypothetical protein